MTKKKRIIKTAVLLLVMTVFMAAFSVTAFADGGSVSQAIEGTWNTASGQIKDVVNNVVFPIIDVILAVFFFAKLGLAYFDHILITARADTLSGLVRRYFSRALSSR